MSLGAPTTRGQPSLFWLLCLRSDTSDVCPVVSTFCPSVNGHSVRGLTASRAIVPIDQGRVSGDPIVPQNHSPWRPLDSTLEILRICHVIIQELQQVVAFFLLEADDVSCELRVDIQSFLSSCRMSTNKWMDLCDGEHKQIDEKMCRILPS